MKTLSNKERKKFTEKFPYVKLEKNDLLKYEEKEKFYLIGNELTLVEKNDLIFPFLKSSRIDFGYFKSAIIDMPAVPFICNGADLLRPGVVKFDNFQKDEIIIIRDEKNNVKLAVMQALFNSDDAEKMQKGRIAKSLHYFNDLYWKNN